MVGQGITLFGSSLVYFAVMWYITLETQSGIMMMLIMIAGMLPMFLISPFAGVWADRYNKKLLINVSDSFTAVVTLAMGSGQRCDCYRMAVDWSRSVYTLIGLLDTH